MKITQLDELPDLDKVLEDSGFVVIGEAMYRDIQDRIKEMFPNGKLDEGEFKKLIGNK